MLKNRITFSVLLISSILLAYFNPNFISSVFFHSMVYIIVLSLVHLLYSYITIKISQNLELNIVEHGQSVRFKCQIYNEGFLPTSSIKINFLYNSNMFKGQLEPHFFALHGGKSKRFEYNLSCKYRGVYTVGVETLEIVDILNIFKVKVRNIEARNVTVLPKVSQLPNFTLEPKAESYMKSISSISAEGANSLVDVRKFEQGDQIKHIHWKLSARHNELLVRNLERSAQNSTLVFLDTSKGKYNFTKSIIVEDKLMEAMVSVVNQCLIQHHIIEVNYHNYYAISKTYSNKDAFTDFFIDVSKLSFSQSKSIKFILDDYFNVQHYNQNLWGKDVFLFTCHPELLENESTILKIMSSNCTIHIVSCSYNDNKSECYRASNGIYYYNLSPSSNLQDIFVRRLK